MKAIQVRSNAKDIKKKRKSSRANNTNPRALGTNPRAMANLEKIFYSNLTKSNILVNQNKL